MPRPTIAPPRQRGYRMVCRTIRVDRDDWDSWASAANEAGLTISDLVRTASSEYAQQLSLKAKDTNGAKRSGKRKG